MKKRVLSLLLAVTMLLSAAPMTTALADEGTAEESVVLTKTLVPAAGGQPDRLKLEAYVRGDVTHSESVMPTDIVLVLDQSGSMAGTYLRNMRSAVETFVEGVAALNTENNDAYRVAIVGFASESGYSDNTEILTAMSTEEVTSVEYRVVAASALDTSKNYYIASGMGYRQIRYNQQMNAWRTTGGGRQQTVNVNTTTVYERVEVTTDNPVYGVAYNDLTTDDYANALINCTSTTVGTSGALTAAIAELDSDGATRTDLGMQMAADIFAAQPTGTYGTGVRNKVVVLITDGVPTTWTEFDTTVANDAVEAALGMKNDGAHIFSMYLGTPAESSRSFLQAVSSNYPNATAWDTLGTQAATTYYSAHSDTAAIDAVFSSIVSAISANTRLSEQSVVTDTISPYFELPDGVDTSAIKVYTVEYVGNDVWAEEEVPFEAAQVSVSGADNKTVSVTNFNFAYHCITETDKIPSDAYTDHGRKLVIYIPIVEDSDTETFGGYLPTNDAAAIYETSDSTDTTIEADGCYNDVVINYSLTAAERVHHIETNTTYTTTYGAFLTEDMSAAQGGISVLQEAITRIPDGSNNTGVNMVFSLVDPGDTADDPSTGTPDPGDDKVLATLTIYAGNKVMGADGETLVSIDSVLEEGETVAQYIQDPSNWTWNTTNAPQGEEEPLAVSIPDGSNMAEKVLILACRLTSIKEVTTPDTALVYSYLDLIVTNDDSYVVYGEIDDGGMLTVAPEITGEDLKGTIYGNTYTEAVEKDGTSDVMTFTAKEGYEIIHILKLTKDDGNDVRVKLYDPYNTDPTTTKAEFVDGESFTEETDDTTDTFTAQVIDITTDTAYEVTTRVKQYKLTTEAIENDADDATDTTADVHIMDGTTYDHDAQNKLNVWFHAIDGHYVTSLAVAETKNDVNEDNTYTAAELLDMTAEQRESLGITLVTGTNGTGETIILSGTVDVPKTQDNYVAVTGTERVYKLTYEHYIENATGYTTWNLATDTTNTIANRDAIDKNAPHTQVFYLPYGATLKEPAYYNTLNSMLYEGDRYTFTGAYTTYTGTEFTGYVDIVDVVEGQKVITATMPAHDMDYYGFWAKDPDIPITPPVYIEKKVSGTVVKGETFTFNALFMEQVVGTVTISVADDGAVGEASAINILLTAAQNSVYESGSNYIYLYEVGRGTRDEYWSYDDTVYQLRYENGASVLYLNGEPVATETITDNGKQVTASIATFTNTSVAAPKLSVEKTLAQVLDADGQIKDLSQTGVVVGDTIEWTITVKNTGVVAGTFDLSDKLENTLLTSEDKTVSGVKLYAGTDTEREIELSGDALKNIAIAVDETLTYIARYTVAESDAGGSLVNTAKITEPGEDPEEDPADPVDVAPYTVTYTDGVDGKEVFADQVTKELPYGEATPKFTDPVDGDETPTRPGYIFKGWTPEVADTVTGHAVYTATWEEEKTELDVSKTVESIVRDGEEVTFETDSDGDVTTPVEVGDVITWKIVITHTGGAIYPITPDSVKDILKIGEREIQLDVVNFTWADFGDGEDTAVLYATYTVQEADKSHYLVNTVVANGETTEGPEIPVAPVLDISKTVSAIYDAKGDAKAFEIKNGKVTPAVEVGDTVEWTITITHEGGADFVLNSDVLQDVLNIGRSKVTLDTTLNGSTIIMGVGDTVILTAEYTVKDDDEGETLVNTVTVNGKTEEAPEVPVEKEEEEPVIEPGKVILTKVDAETGEELAGAKFELYHIIGNAESAELVGEYTTDRRGQIKVDEWPDGRDLYLGTYYFVETQPPEGYRLDAEPITFTIEDGKDTKIEVTNETTGTPSTLNGIDHWAYIIGYPDGNVRPQGNITRAEVATIFFRLLTDEVREEYMTAENAFSDVNPGQWFNNAISTLSSMGIVNGYPDGTFKPNGYITRAEFAAIAARFEEHGDTTEADFSDVYGDHWAADEIAIAYNNGWIQGYPDGTFKPNQLITRAEAMTVVNRVLNRIPKTPEDLLDDMITWPDNMNEDAWYYLAVQEATNSHEYEHYGERYERWTDLRPVRDWTLLEY